MPLYDFACTCGHTFDQLVRAADSSAKCPRCLQVGSSTKLPSAPANIVFRGSGFYATDYKGSRNQ